MAAQDESLAGIGSLRRRMTLEAPVASPDGIGGATHQFATVAAVWVRLDWVGGAERWRAGRPEQVATHRAVMRWRAGVDAGQRLRDGARIFEIRTVADPDGSRRRLVCLVQETMP